MLTSARRRISGAKGSDNRASFPEKDSRKDHGESLWKALSMMRGDPVVVLPLTKIHVQKILKGRSKRSSMVLLGLVFLLFVAMNTGLHYLHSLDGGAKKIVRLAATKFWVTMEDWHVFRPLRKFDLNYALEYPELSVLEDNFDVIQEEAEALLKIKDNLRPLGEILKDGGIHKNSWTTMFLQINTGDTIEENAKFAPRTAALIKDIPGVYTAFFSILDPKAHLSVHWGYFKGYVRYHLGVKIPNNNKDKQCWIRFNPDWPYNKVTEAAVTAGDRSMMENQEKYYWKEGEGVLFDDNYLHEAANESDEPRVVLFLDVARKMPWYANIVNKIMLYVAMNDSSMKTLRKTSVVKLRGDASYEANDYETEELHNLV